MPRPRTGRAPAWVRSSSRSATPQSSEGRLDEAHRRLRQRCQAQVERLPELADAGAWIEWLEDWHQRSQRAFEPRESWPPYFESRGTIADALAEMDELFELVHELEARPLESGKTRAELPGELAREAADLGELEGSIERRLAAIGDRYGRIVEDIPAPAAADSPAKLQRVESLLRFLEATLGRFAASARVESQMLEVLR